VTLGNIAHIKPYFFEQAFRQLLPSLLAGTTAAELTEFVVSMGRKTAFNIPSFDEPIGNAAKDAESLQTLRNAVASHFDNEGADRLLYSTLNVDAADVAWLGDSFLSKQRAFQLLLKLLENAPDRSVIAVQRDGPTRDRMLEILLHDVSRGSSQLARLLMVGDLSIDKLLGIGSNILPLMASKEAGKLAEHLVARALVEAKADDPRVGQLLADSSLRITVTRYPDTRFRAMSLNPLKRAILAAAGRLRRGGHDWSLAVLVPANALAASVFEYMEKAEHRLPSYPVEILVSAEGPMLAANLIALLLEPPDPSDSPGALVLDALAAFELGKSEIATQGAMTNANRYRGLAARARAEGDASLRRLVVGRGVETLIQQAAGLALSGDPMTDWLTVRRLLDENPRAEIKAVGKEARHMRLLHRGAQIESRLAEAWRSHGCYRNARTLLAAAVVEDQFAATTRPHRGVTVMTIHKAKGKEFDEVIVFEGMYQRYLQRQDAEGQRSARFNLHVAATRARRAVTIMTPQTSPCPLLPQELRRL
jgi:hypothetical protein